MQSQKATGYIELKKFHQCFIYKQQYFMVEIFLNCDGQPSLLRIETSKEQSEIQISPLFKSSKK